MREYHEEFQYLPEDYEAMDKKLLWHKVKSKMKKDTTELSYNTWIEPLVIDHIDIVNAIVYLSWTKQEKLIGHIEDYYTKQLETAFYGILKKNYRVVIQHMGEPEPDKPGLGLENGNYMPSLLYLSKEYTFDHFFHNDSFSAKVAPYAAKEIAEQMIRDFNPLVICGGFGLGKTHLLHAVGNEIIKTNKTAKVLIISADYFIAQYEEARERGCQTSFRDSITSADCLLVDDIQFLRDIRHQRAFIYVFDSYFCQNKPIVITSDENPESISLMSDSLKERLGWGLVTMLEMPDYETRKLILRDTLDRIGIEQNDGVNEVIDYISKNSCLTPRDVKASIKKVVAISRLMECEISAKNAEMVLREI